MQEGYYAASPYNLIAVEKGRVLPGDSAENDVYTRAAQKLEEWIAQKILVQDAAPGIYLYSQDFTVPGTHSHRLRTGFIALGRIEDYEAQVVFRHERTLSAPKADRMELLRHTHAQTGQLFMLYEDSANRIESWLEDFGRRNPPLELRDEYDVIHRLWPIADSALIERVRNEMSSKKLIIADGHHRYETALNYRNECRTRQADCDPMAAHEFAMMTFFSTHSKGLTILPTNRLVRNLPDFDFERFRRAVAPYFDWYSYPFQNAEEREASYPEFHKDLTSPHTGRRTIGVYAGGGAFYLFVLRRDADLEQLLPDISPAQRGLDVVLLHRLILDKGLGITPEAVAAEKNISYEREASAAIEAVDKGQAQLACLLNPVHVQQVVDIALGGDVLPQKSTDFYPKLLSGLAIYRIEGRVD